MRLRTYWSITLVAFLGLNAVGCRGRSAASHSSEASATTNGDVAASDTASKVSRDDDGAPKIVTLAPDTQKRLGIAVSAVAGAPLALTLDVPGTVQANESQVSHVRPLARGRIEAVHVRVGDRVTRGQALADFDNIEAGELASQAAAAGAELGKLQVQLATATRQAERSRKLLDIGATSQREYEASVSDQREIEASIHAQQSTIAGMEARLRRFGDSHAASAGALTSVRSPLTGVVTQVSTAPGDVVDPSDELFTIADISRVYVQAHVFEKDLGQVRVGQTASILVDAYPNERFTGKVVMIGDVIDPQSRTANVRCDVANPRALLKLNMFARVQLPTGTMHAALAVPADAVQSMDGRSVIFVRTSPSRFAIRPVETGRTVGTLIEIAEGLRPGESVVTRGAFQVKSAAMASALGEQDEE